MITMEGYDAESCPTEPFYEHAQIPALPHLPARTSTLYTIPNTNLAFKRGLTTKADNSAKRGNTAGLLFSKKRHVLRLDLK